jgi:hypothetical protein
MFYFGKNIQDALLYHNTFQKNVYQFATSKLILRKILVFWGQCLKYLHTAFEDGHWSMT